MNGTCQHTRKQQFPGRGGLLVGAVIAFVALGAGCDTLSQDFNDFAASVFPASPQQAARWAVDPYDPGHRRKGTLLLANAPWGGNPPYPKMYREYVASDPDPLVKAVAIQALARHGTPEDATLIARQLLNESVHVRWESARGLQRLHNPKVVAVLLTVLRNVDEVPDVRVAAAFALGQYSEDAVFQGLVAALDERELAVNLAATESLGTLTGKDFGVDSRAWLAWYDTVEGDPFADGTEYLYRTYARDKTFLEHLAFWSNPPREYPGTPAGLRPESERRTYEDEETTEASGG